jgi:glycine/D-amino acid oxidase-like deaminating enzyme
VARAAKRSEETVGDNEAFVTLMQLAREDPQVGQVLQSILARPALQRKALVKALVDDMTRRAAPADFVQAIAALLDDEAARKAAEII